MKRQQPSQGNICPSDLTPDGRAVSDGALASRERKASWTWPSAADSRLGWALFGVLLVAVVLRSWNLVGWSMWEDEAGSMFWAGRLDKPFPSSFPIFFASLNRLLQVAGMSVGVARLLPATMGILSVVLTYLFSRRLVSREAAILAALLVAVNMGHVFWSQSIRYYTMVLVFQMLSAYWFIDGFERKKPLSLLLSNLAFVAAMLTHFSALLLAPVFIAYLVLMIWRREAGGAYRPRYYLLFALPLVAILGVFAWRIMQMQNLMGGWAIPSARDPVHISLTIVAYFGIPLLVLGLLGPFFSQRLPRRSTLFLLTLSLVPLLELLVLAQLNLINVTWYYALISMPGVAALAADGLVSLYRRGWRRTVLSALTVSLAYYAALLVGYFTTMHGDRPRWEEAAAYVRQTAEIHAGSAGNARVITNVPWVLAFYLGLDPLEADTSGVVRLPDLQPSIRSQGADSWYILEAKLISEDYRAFLADHCVLRAKFEAYTGPVDRSVLVYQCTPDLGQARGAQSSTRNDLEFVPPLSCEGACSLGLSCAWDFGTGPATSSSLSGPDRMTTR